MKTQSFQKKRKIRSSRDFKIVFEKGKKFHISHFKVFVSPSDLPAGRLGISVSKRVGDAHERNRIKRVVREAFRRREDLPPSFDWVFIVGPSSEREKNSVLFQELNGFFNRFIHRGSHGYEPQGKLKDSRSTPNRGGSTPSTPKAR